MPRFNTPIEQQEGEGCGYSWIEKKKKSLKARGVLMAGKCQSSVSTHWDMVPTAQRKQIQTMPKWGIH